jgi:hypothetical protein
MSRCRMLLAAMLAVAAPHAAHAVFHIAVINEVMTSYGGDSSVQFVEIAMQAAGQTQDMNTVLGAFGPTGTYLGDVLIVPGNVTNSGVGVTWLMATTQFQTLTGLTPDFIMPAGLPTGAGMVCWGAPGAFAVTPPANWDHSDPSKYVDCVAFNGYTGPTNSHIGTPTALDANGHSLSRVHSSNNNSADFTCGDPATPKNNAAASASMNATSPCPATPTPTNTATRTPTRTPTATPTLTPTSTSGPTSTSTPTVTPIPPMHDAVVLPRKALNFTLLNATPVTKKLTVKVRNADPATEVPDDSITLATATDCPAGVSVGAPDFDGKTPGAQSSIVIPGGKTKTATVLVTVHTTDFVTFNHKAPNRCTITLTASTDVPGNADPTLSNNSLGVELNVVDRTDPEGTAVHEDAIKSIAPLSIAIASGKSSAVKKAKPTVVNADLLHPPEPAMDHPIQLVVSNDACGIAGTPAFVPSTIVPDDTALVAGGASKTASLPITVSDAGFTTPNPKSPTRCTVRITAVGPGGDTDPTNNATTLTVDVIDKNDVP